MVGDQGEFTPDVEFYDKPSGATDALSEACLAQARRPLPGEPMVRDGDRYRPARFGETPDAAAT
jgi:hypothetical protein